MAKQSFPVFLGIDTGGTYTDAVLFNRDKGVLAKAKALTTRHDLAIGISGAMDRILERYQGALADIRLVSISTTLATNALVEGKGSSVGLVMIGFEEADMEKADLKAALSGDPVIFLPGGHDVQGNARPLDLEKLGPFIDACEGSVSGYAVAGYFAVRNASHETKVRDVLIEKTGLPVTCSHELSSKLGGPKRALTTLLNARLVPVIEKLIKASRSHLDTTGITAPLMVMRGDGTLVDADFALAKPIETILSGPAASLVGAKYLMGKEDGIISDIGGTTTDVAILERGWPRIEPEGATVGAFTTMVEAVAMYTYGLGGDSVVSVDPETGASVFLGPRRQLPVSLLAMQFPEIIEVLETQLKATTPGQFDGRFVMLSAEMSGQRGGLRPLENKVFDRLTHQPAELKSVIKGASELGAINKLVSRGLAQLSGFTPSDAMHVLGLQDNWHAHAAELAARLFARTRDRFGKPIADDHVAVSEMVKTQMTVQSANVILETCLAEDGIKVGPGAEALINRALSKTSSVVQFSLELRYPLVGLGASAATYYPAIGERLSTPCVIPDHADVSNAIGAVASEVRVTDSILVTSSDGGSSFMVLLPQGPQIFHDEEVAIECARSELEKLVIKQAHQAGTDEPALENELELQAPDVEGKRHFVQCKITVTATGAPRIIS